MESKQPVLGGNRWQHGGERGGKGFLNREVKTYWPQRGKEGWVSPCDVGEILVIGVVKAGALSPIALRQLKKKLEKRQKGRNEMCKVEQEGGKKTGAFLLRGGEKTRKNRKTSISVGGLSWAMGGNGVVRILRGGCPR